VFGSFERYIAQREAAEVELAREGVVQVRADQLQRSAQSVSVTALMHVHRVPYSH
jgi:hypothetical protein